jgi:hypothetical protein
MSARFLRQELLAEVGGEGQRRIERATARVAGDGPGELALAHEVACLYALGAGFASVAPGPVDVDALAPRSVVSSASARAVLAGARAALAAMRAALAPDEVAS